MPFEHLTNSQREGALRALLRGRRLAFEVGLSEELFESASRTFRNAGAQWQYDSRRLDEHPATLVILLAAAGNTYYRKVKSLWAHVGVTGIETVTVGRAFLLALKRLRLETFDALVEDQSALTYLAPILAHGGVPVYCLPDFFRLMNKSIGTSTEAVCVGYV